MSSVPLLERVHAARAHVSSDAIRTPLIRLQYPKGEPEIYLKLENLQPTGSFKIRGAANAMHHLSPAELSKGVVTASMGNMAQGVALGARRRGVPCTVVAPEAAAETKIRAIERLGARVVRVTFDEWWRAFQERRFDGASGAFIHAFDDIRVMEGDGTIALEIVEDLPDVDAVIVPWGGGGLACGIASVLRSVRPECRIYAAEVVTAAPLSAALREGRPVNVEYQASFVDGIGAKSVFPQMLERCRTLLDGALIAGLDRVGAAVRYLAERHHVIAEGAGACPVACAVDHSTGARKIVCVVSGGNINPSVLTDLMSTATPPDAFVA